jgi:hypothetical protein
MGIISGWMDGSPPRKLHHLRIALGPDVVVQNIFHLFQSEIESRTGLRETQGTGHVASSVHFNDAEAGMLLVIRTEPAVVRTTILHLGCKLDRDCSRLIEFR